MNKSFWNKVAGAKGKTLACVAIAALSAVLLFVVCGDKGTDPKKETCDIDPTAYGCPGYVDPTCPSTQPGCPGYVDPTCPSTQPGCPGYVPPGGTTKWCYWAPNQYNDYVGGCSEIGGEYCTTPSCATESGCTAASGTVMTQPNCADLPTTGEPTDPCVANPTPGCPNYCPATQPGCPGYSDTNPATGTFCYWGPNPSTGAAASCEPIGGQYCEGYTCTEALCRGAYGTVIEDCNNPPTTNYCDYGPPAIVGGQTIGGCHPTTASACDEGGTMVTTCPNYPPPTEGGYCDYGFGNCIPSSQAACNEYGAFTSTCPAASGKYCDFGQPTQYGDGGCYFRPSVTVCDEWSEEVSMSACIQSNTTNPTISNPCAPGGGSWTCK
jgi:hypothetical protein